MDMDFAAEVLAEVNALQDEGLHRQVAIQTVAVRRNFGVFGIEQYVEAAEAAARPEFTPENTVPYETHRGETY